MNDLHEHDRATSYRELWTLVREFQCDVLHHFAPYGDTSCAAALAHSQAAIEEAQARVQAVEAKLRRAIEPDADTWLFDAWNAGPDTGHAA